MCLPHIDIFRVYDGKCSQCIVYGNPYDIYIKNVWINSHHFKENYKQKWTVFYKILTIKYRSLYSVLIVELSFAKNYNYILYRYMV